MTPSLSPVNGARAHEQIPDWDPADPPPKPLLLGASEIFAPRPPVKWACQALGLAPGAPLLAAGYGFSGKTLSFQDLFLAVASNSLAWGKFAVRPGRALHLDFEQGDHLTCTRYQRLARARGLHPDELEGRLALAVLPNWYLDADAADRLEAACEGFDLALIDSFRAACPRTDENSSEARIPLDRLTRISERTGTAFVVIHHARKPSQNGQGGQGGARMAVRGSGSLYDASGSVLVFAGEKGEPVTVAHEKDRLTGTTHPDFRLHIEDVAIGDDPRAGLRVTYMDGAAAGADHLASLKARVVELIRQEGVVTGGVALFQARLGARKDDVRAAIADLVQARTIAPGGTYHKPTYSMPGTDRDDE